MPGYLCLIFINFYSFMRAIIALFADLPELSGDLLELSGDLLVILYTSPCISHFLH
jgi:hypothetical protein